MKSTVIVIVIGVITNAIVTIEAGALDHFLNGIKPQNHFLEQRVNNTVEDFRRALAHNDPFIIPSRMVSGKLFSFSFDSVIYSGFSDFVLQYLNIDVMQESATASLSLRRLCFEANNVQFKTITPASAIEINKAEIIFKDLSYDAYGQFNVLLRRLDALISFNRVEKIEVFINGHIFGIPIKIAGNQPFLVDFFNIISAEANAFLDVFIRLAINLALLSV